MVIVGEHPLYCTFHIREIDHHAIFILAIDHDFNFVGMAVQLAAFRVTRQEMCAIYVVGRTKFHGFRVMVHYS